MSTSRNHEMPAIGNWNNLSCLPVTSLSIFESLFYFPTYKGHFYRFCINLKEYLKSLLCTMNKKVLCMRTVSDYIPQSKSSWQVALDMMISAQTRREQYCPQIKITRVPGCVVLCPLFRAANVPNVRHYGGLSRARMWVTASLTLLLPEAEAGESTRAGNEPSRSLKFTITEKVSTRTLSWLKAATTAFTFNNLLRHYDTQALTQNM